MTDLSASKPVILVVDDSRLMRVAARKILSSGFEIVEAADGEIAWDTLQSDSRITLVMSDLSMPNLDGLGLLENIRTSDDCRLRELPVIIVTGAEDDDGSKKVALGAGASDFITKPFESVQLLARTRSQIDQQHTRQALQQSESTQKKLKEQSAVDSLTGLANAQAFTDQLERSVSCARRQRTELSVLQIRIDKYKILFLRRGKRVAEELLQKVAVLFTQSRRQEDTVARLGLDSFAILLPSANNIGARRIAGKLREGVEQLAVTDQGTEIKVTASIAVTEPAIEHSTTAADILKDGRRKLELAGESGGNHVQYLLSPQADTEKSPRPQDPGKHEATVADVAGAKEVARVIHSLSSGNPPGTDLDRVIRAVLPALRSWNQSRNGQFTGVIDQLEAAVGHARAAVTPPAAGTGEPCG